MTIAFKIGDDTTPIKGLIYMDAVTSYTRSIGGKVTSHPVDSGVSVSDHFISDNAKFQVEGVITGVDLTGLSSLVKIGDDKPNNSRSKPTAAQITETEDVLKFLPSAVKQFFPGANPKVKAQKGDEVSLSEIEGILTTLLNGVFYNEVEKRWRNKMVTTTLYEMEGTNFKNARTDLIITEVSFREDVNTGEALYLSITLEKLRFVSLLKVDAPKNVKPTVKKKLDEKASKGKLPTASGLLDTAKGKVDALSPASSFREAAGRLTGR
jgi:hypothetical protein